MATAETGIWGGLNQASQNALGVGMNLIDMGQRRDARDAALQETQQHNRQIELIGQQKLVEEARLRATQEAANALAEKKYLAENPHDQVFNMPQYARLDSALRISKIPVDDLPFMQEVKAIAADPRMKKGDMAEAFHQNWSKWKVDANESLTKKVASLSEKAAAIPEDDLKGKEKRKEIMMQVEQTFRAMDIMGKIPDGEAKKYFFPDIYQKEQNTARALEELKQANRPEKNPTEASLYADAARGDVGAQKAVKAMEQARINVAQQSRAPKEAEKPSRVAYRDTVDGRILYYDKNNPEDRKQLETFGSRLAPVADDPVKVLIQQGMTGQGGGAAVPPEGFTDTGRTTMNGKKVYAKGDQAWIAP